jgi:D-alanyl-D-alanine carboxypeptidase
MTKIVLHTTLTLSLFFTVGFATIIATSISTPAHAAKNNKYASIVMDADSGVILHERHADKVLHPASLTKVMTLVMLFEAMDRGDITLNQRVRISRHAAGMVPSKLDLPAGSSIRVKDAIYVLVTKSANDVAVAVAEHVGGTEATFARLMTRRARDLGMSKTTFRNASGLHDKRQVTSARDMAKLARFVIQTYPTYYRYFSRQNFTYRGKSYRNHNRLMETYRGMDGMKTGYINASGFNLIASAVQNRRRLIGVVFGGRSSKTRNSHMKELLDKSFRSLNNVRTARATSRKSPIFEPPVPTRKPTGLVTLAAAQKPTVKVQADMAARLTKTAPSTTKFVAIDQALTSGRFGEIAGQGDIDPDVSKRIETGLMAIQKVQTPEKTIQNAAPKPEQDTVKTARYTPPQKDTGARNWAIQIGAFSSRAKTESILHSSVKKLPKPMQTGKIYIAALKTDKGWIFRGRLTGLTQIQAARACQIVQDCITIKPSTKTYTR